MADDDPVDPMDDNMDDGDEDEAAPAVPLKEFTETFIKGGKQKWDEWHKEIMSKPPRFEKFLANMEKNRYPNVVLYDSTRVRIKDGLGEDYIHASWIDSYEKPRGYICAQAPFDDKTDRDFWRMCLMVKPLVVIVLTPCNVKDKRTIRQFWPDDREGKKITKTNFLMKCTMKEDERDQDRYELSIDDEKDGKVLWSFPLVQYNAWTDDRTLPVNLLEFRASVRILMAQRTKEIKATPTSKHGAIVLVCPSGVHRCGTYVGLDVVLDRVAAERKVGLPETVTFIREARYGTFEFFEHYMGIADIVVRHAVSSNIVNPDAIAKRK